MVDKEELIKKYNIDIIKLEKEQLKLSKRLEIKDKIDFSLADKLGAVDVTFIKNKILCCFIICNREFEIIDQAYFIEKIRFPYISGFRAYRELPVIVSVFEKLREIPDIIFVPGQGIIHPRLGIASHLSLSIGGIPTIGVSNSIIDCEIKNNNIIKNGKKIGKVLISKAKSKPMYISPGNLISIDTAFNLSNEFINPPHKKPEPLHLAGKYLKKVKKELI